MLKSLIPKQYLQKSLRPVYYLKPEEVNYLAKIALENNNLKKGKRNNLLILLLFQTGLRVSEALSLTPSNLDLFEGKPVLRILGKGKKPRIVSLPERLADKLKSYAYENQIGPKDKFFSINRQRAWQIIKEVSEKAGLNKKVYPHLFRRSDAIERLRQTGNPKALQHHLGHSSLTMVMRYLSTLTEEDSLRIQQEVRFDESQ